MESFIKPTSIPSIFQNSGLNAFAADFNSEHYSPSLHAELNLPLPSALETAFDKRKSEFLAGRYCAREALVPFSIEPSFILGRGAGHAPIWPDEMIGSITHSQNKCFVVTGKERPLRSVGIDSEDLMSRKNEIERIEKLISCLSEGRVLDELSKKIERAVGIGILFTVKESAYKAIFPITQNCSPFTDIEITEIDLEQGKASWQTTRDLGFGFPKRTDGNANFEWDGKWMHAIVSIPSKQT